MLEINRRVRFQRNVLIGVAVLLCSSNIVLALAISTQEKMVVLVPTLEHELNVGSHFVSDEYLKLRAEQVLYLLFSMRAENTDYVTQQLLRQVSPLNEQDFKSQIEALGEDIKSRGYRYWFTNIQSFEIDNTDLKVKVSGYLETYLADRQIDKKFKQYQLSFKNRAGLVQLETFSEVHNEKNG
jgi:conjugal transfer pilus assembly protein TraE